MGYDSSSLTAAGEGTAILIDLNGIFWILKNSLYVPKLNSNLVALSQLASQITTKTMDDRVNVFLDNSMTPSFSCPTKSKVLERMVNYGLDASQQEGTNYGIKGWAMSTTKKPKCSFQPSWLKGRSEMNVLRVS
ncbi:hypothetical protein O181_033966 [Austropuccinia psidii MF-1]|uniref:Uncharacterized protein n=1 Tax=Austropuccinia psidii MF-1 TaxID=1389203 RepID=A0A9Q3CZS1_9BASI|nr:hypothetical protein [Austropuccinia psidii MF-1]